MYQLCAFLFFFSAWYVPCAGSIADEMMIFVFLEPGSKNVADGPRDILSHYKVSTHTHKKAQGGSTTPTHKRPKGHVVSLQGEHPHQKKITPSKDPKTSLSRKL